MIRCIRIAGIALLGACTKPSVQPGSCVSAALSQPLVVPAKIVPVEDQSFGGFIEFSTRSSSGERRMCTAFVESVQGDQTGAIETVALNSDANAPKMTPIVIWTARHCLDSSKIKDLKFQLSLKQADGNHAYKELKIKLDMVDKISRLEENLAPELFKKFIGAYQVHHLRNIGDTIETFGRLKELSKAAGRAVDPEISGDEFEDFFSVLRRKLNEEKAALGKTMCNDTREMTTSAQNSKVCMTYDDLVALKGSLEIDDEGIVERKMTSQTSRHKAFQEEVKTSNKFKEDFDKPEYKEFADDANVNYDILTLWKKSFKDLNDLTLQLAYWDVCANANANANANNSCRVPPDTSPADNGGMLQSSLNQLFKITTRKFLDEKILVNLKNKTSAWDYITMKVLRNRMNILSISMNVGFGDNNNKPYFDSFGFQDMIASETLAPLILRPYGLIHWGVHGRVEFLEGDSGSMISIGGVYPIAMVSSVNNKPTSGGIAASSLPVYRAPTSSSSSTDPGNIAQIPRVESQPVVYEDGQQSGISGSTKRYTDVSIDRASSSTREPSQERASASGDRLDPATAASPESGSGCT